MKKMRLWVKKNESGQGLVEYALIVAFVSLVVWVSVEGFGQKVSDLWGSINEVFSSI